MIIPKEGNPNRQHFIQQANALIAGLSPTVAWKITATRYRKKRSLPQNSYFWGVIVDMIHKDTGNESNDIHDVLCGECFGWQEYEVMGLRKRRPVRGTSQLTVDEFVEFCEWCRAFAATNLGIVIPEPNEVM